MQPGSVMNKRSCFLGIVLLFWAWPAAAPIHTSPTDFRGVGDMSAAARAEEAARQRAKTAYLWQAQVLTNLHPYRQIDGIYWDLMRISAMLPSTPPESRPAAIQRWRFWPAARILQVVDEGLLIVDGDSTSLVVNHPFSHSAFDDGRLPGFAAYEIGTFEYVSVGKARMTVRKYDYGKPFNPKQRAAELARARTIQGRGVSNAIPAQPARTRPAVAEGWKVVPK